MLVQITDLSSKSCDTTWRSEPRFFVPLIFLVYFQLLSRLPGKPLFFKKSNLHATSDFKVHMLFRLRIDHFWLESTVGDSIWLKNRPNLMSFETKSMWLVGSQSVVWFSNFTKTCKLLFMKRGTKVLCDKRSRFSDHFAHPMHSEQAGLEIWMIDIYLHRKYTRNPSKSVSEPAFSTVIGSMSLSWFHWNLGISNDFFEITFLLPVRKYFQNVVKHEISLFTPRKNQLKRSHAMT